MAINSWLRALKGRCHDDFTDATRLFWGNDPDVWCDWVMPMDFIARGGQALMTLVLIALTLLTSGYLVLVMLLPEKF